MKVETDFSFVTISLSSSEVLLNTKEWKYQLQEQLGAIGELSFVNEIDKFL